MKKMHIHLLFFSSSTIYFSTRHIFFAEISLKVFFLLRNRISQEEKEEEDSFPSRETGMFSSKMCGQMDKKKKMKKKTANLCKRASEVKAVGVVKAKYSKPEHKADTYTVFVVVVKSGRLK